MEASLLTQALAGVLVWAALVYALLLRPWRPRRLIRRLAPGVDGLFLAGLALGALALHQPAPFRRTAELLVAQTALAHTLTALDRRIESIEQLPERLWAELADKLGWPPDEAPPESTRERRRLVERAVMPGVIGLLEVLLRGFAYTAALLLLAVSPVLRLVAGSRRGSEPLPAQRRTAELEARVAALEEALRTPHNQRGIEAP